MILDRRALDRLVGVPWVDRGRDLQGLDCWGLVVIVNRLRGVELPDYSDRYVTAHDSRDIARLIAGELPAWREIPKGGELAFDCVLIRDEQIDSHVGVVVAPGLMLHVARGRSSEIARYRVSPIVHRVVGFFRHLGS